MANLNRPFGFVPVGTTDGSDYHGKMRDVAFLASDNDECFVGDMVRLTGTTTADGRTPVVTRATAGTGNPIIGAIVGFYPEFSTEAFLSEGGNYRRASTARTARIVYGTDVIFMAQTSTSLTAADAGQNADIVLGTGNTITGISGQEIGAAIAAGATGQLRLRNLSSEIGAVLGADANWFVNINENQDDHGTGV